MHGERSNSSLVMVGTVHRDPKGYGKLLRILQSEEPDFITVEISSYALEFRAKQAPLFRAALRENLKKIQREDEAPYRRLLSHGEIQGIFLLLKVPFEWRAAEGFADRHRIGVKAIDLSVFSQKKLARISELIQPDNLRALLRSDHPPLDRKVEWQYEKAQTLWNSPAATDFNSGEMQEREKHMSAEIRRLLEKSNKWKILHIGGWEHLLLNSRRKSLYERLEEFRPRRILLNGG